MSTRPGSHGGKIITLIRTGSRWLSDYRSVDFDPQEIRAVYRDDGTRGCGIFRIRILTDTIVEVPDGTEFTGALKNINAQLKLMGKEPIEHSFYVTESEKKTPTSQTTFGGMGKKVASPWPAEAII